MARRNVGFGSRLDLDGDVAIIDGFHVTNSGGNWGTPQALLPDQPTSRIHNAAIDDNTIVVLSKADVGVPKISVLFNDGDGWSLQAEWNSGHGQLLSPIGLAVSSDRLVVAYPSEDASGINSGRLRVYQRVGNNWSEVQRILDPMLRSGNKLGEELRMEGAGYLQQLYRVRSSSNGMAVHIRWLGRIFIQIKRLVQMGNRISREPLLFQVIYLLIPLY